MEDWFADLIDDGTPRFENFYLPDMHLRAALDFEPVRNLTISRERLNKHQKRSEGLLEESIGKEMRYMRVDIHRLIPLLWEEALKFPNTSELEITRAVDQAKLLLSGASTCDLIKNVRANFSDESYRARSFSEWIQSCTVLFTKVIVDSRESNHHVVHKKTENISLWFSSEFGVMCCRNDWYVFDHNSWLMLCDVIHQRSAAFLISETYQMIGDEHIPSLRKLQTYYQWGDKILKERGVMAYGSLKLWEPLIMGKLMSLAEDDISDPSEFYREMKTEALAEMGDHFQEFETLFSEESDPDILGELFGIYRHWGHPFTYVELAIYKNRSKSVPYHSIDPSFTRRVEREFKQMICEGYFRQYGHWPTLNLRFLREDSELKRAFETGTPIVKKSSRYHVQDWDKVYGSEIFDKGDNLNILNVLQDKAAAVTLSHLKKLVARQTPNTWHARRVLSSWLDSNYTCPKTILSKFESEGIDPENLLIGLAKKERELNIIPRLFSLMPLELKLYFGLTENLIARDLLPLVPECTMTDSLQALQDKIISNVMFVEKDLSSIPIFISLDFEKWNLQFRHENTHGCFSFIDQLYGWSRVFSSTHKIFESIRFYYFGGDKNLIAEDLELPESPYSWTGQRGGCEGLRQKGWTLVTIALLKISLAEFHLRFTILGQGDNQMIVLSMPCPAGATRENLTDEQRSHLREKIAKIKSAVVESSRSMGLPLKAQETWVSNSVFSYGKAIYFKGRPLRGTIKRLCRAFPYANEDYPSVETALTSVVASAQAATSCGPNALGPFIFSLIEGRRVIRWHLKYSLLVEGGFKAAFVREYQDAGGQLSESQVKYLRDDMERIYFPLLLGANNLGGAPFANFWDYLVRGFPDPLVAQVSYLLELRESPDLAPYQRSMIDNLLHPNLSKRRDYTLLLQDPLSLNVENPIAIGNILKRSAQDMLKADRVRNPLMREVVSISVEDQTKIVDFLSQAEPFAPAVCASILSASIPGMVSSLIAKFDKTRTLIKMAREAGVPLERKIRSAEEKTLMSWLSQACTKKDDTVIACPTMYSQKLRELSWGKRLAGVTVPHPLHLFRREALPGRCSLIHDSPEFISVRYSNVVIGKSEVLTQVIGPCNPYRGSETMEKISLAKEWEVTQVPSATRGSSELLKMIGWFVRPESNMEKFLEEIFACYTDADPNFFKTMEQSVSGNWIHRFKDLFRKHGGYLSCMPTPATHCKPNTNHMGKYAKGKGNYALHFQALVVAFMHLDFIFRYRRLDLNPSVHFHLRCPECLVELEANEFDSLAPVPKLKKLSEGSGLWASSTSVLRGLKPKFDMSGAFTEYDPDEAKYSSIAREIVSMAVYNKMRRVPPNWFFGIDIERLLGNIACEGPIILIEYWLSHRLPVNLLRERVQEADREWKVKLQSVSTSNFSFLDGIFVDPSNYLQVGHSLILRDSLPMTHPPSPNDLRATIKDLLMTTVQKAKPSRIFPLKEYGPVRAFFRALGESLLHYPEGLDSLVKAWSTITANRISDLFFRSKTFERNSMEYCLKSTIDLPRFQRIYVLTSNVMHLLIHEYSFAPVIKDVVVKDSEYTFQASEISVSSNFKVSWWKFDILKAVKDGISEVSPACWGKGYERIFLSQLSTPHGAFLASLLTKEDETDSFVMFGDGSGGTSLAITSFFPRSRVFIVPYFSQSDTMPDLIESLPPDLVKWNPGANAVVVDSMTVDLTESAPRFRPKETTVVLDMDLIGEAAYRMTCNAIKYAEGARLMIFVSNPSLLMLSELASLCFASSDNCQVRKSLISESSSYLLVMNPVQLKQTQKAMKFSFRSSLSPYLPYKSVEDRLCYRSEALASLFRTRLSWLPIEKGERACLEYLCLESTRFVSSSHSQGVQDTDSSPKMVLNKELSCYYGALILLFYSCGNIRNRMDACSDETCLVTFVDKETEHLAVLDLTYERLCEIRKHRTVYYYTLGSGLWKTFLAKKAAREISSLLDVGALDHQTCEGDCLKAKNYCAWLHELHLLN
uniref:RNA-directed RNA polymerase n=1 Tax=Plasmopara viticola lesion associated mononega virus 1 TaxID=2692008 RepID=A0A6B9Q4D2_9MONO|nr:RNA dependent RNA polymerase [Plasmopara viticola lesion associated mononega virus 1]